jgi:gamma-glutamyl hercynylcysteine S-oxide synthase
VHVAGGSFVLGVDAATEPYSLDNERPAHVVDVDDFYIGRVPVTNGEWQTFIDDDGYRNPKWWSDRGWQHREQAGLIAPQFWNADGTRTRFGRIETIPPDEPVQHVTYFEAEAYAAWAGARLPTEIEWEKACAWDPRAQRAIAPISAAKRCDRRPSVPTRMAHRPMVSSRCSARFGSGHPHRCGHGPDSPR